jgi:hypothetical protein
MISLCLSSYYSWRVSIAFSTPKTAQASADCLSKRASAKYLSVQSFNHSTQAISTKWTHTQIQTECLHVICGNKNNSKTFRGFGLDNTKAEKQRSWTIVNKKLRMGRQYSEQDVQDLVGYIQRVSAVYLPESMDGSTRLIHFHCRCICSSSPTW